jgi:hypothetical protein
LRGEVFRKGHNQKENMKPIKLQLLMVVTGLAFVGTVNAQSFTGSMGVNDWSGGTSYYNNSTLALSATNLITYSETGDFASVVPPLSDLIANTTILTGLSTSATAENISDYFVFSAPDAGFGSSGTTPVDRFNVTLTSITDLGSGTFTGTGTLYDTAVGGYDPTPVIFTIGFSGSPNTLDANYSFTMAAVPEPTTMTILIAGAALLLPFGVNRLRQRKNRVA